MIRGLLPRSQKFRLLAARLELVRLEDRNAASDTVSYLLHAGLGFGATAYLNSLGSDRDTAFGSSGIISSTESLSANQRSSLSDAPSLSAVNDSVDEMMPE